MSFGGSIMKISFCLIIFVHPSLTQSTTINGGGSLNWLPWLVLALALSVAIVLICLAGFYVLHILKKLSNRSVSNSISYTSRKGHIAEEKDGGPISKSSTVNSRLRFPENGPLHDDSEVLVFQSGKPLEVPRENIKILQQLGIGEFGPIYDAEVQLNVNVKSRTLIKVFQKGTAQDLVLFGKELESLMQLNHNKVGKMFGVVSHRPYYSLLELPVNGDLKTFLITTKTSNINLTLEQLVGLATDTANGIAYLQSLNYIHKDIAARNCMVTQTLGVKITDYKVGRYLFRSEYAVQADGTLLPLRWMSPESLLENIFSQQSDVWSFGVVMWEILTRGEYPYCELSDGEVIRGVCYDFQRLLQPVECTENIYQLMLLCWHSNPDQRPRMEYLHQQLEATIINKN